MRISKKKVDLNYKDVREFFKNRSEKFQENNPYAVTMYQDNHPELVRKRNEREIDKLLPLLNLDETSNILDVACGIGRWADAIKVEIKNYVGLDFSEELIEIAQKRNRKDNYAFGVGDARCLEKNALVVNNTYNTVLMVGIAMYLNDEDIEHCLESIEQVCEEHAVICIREPIALKDRLTLKDFFSNELEDNYNVIYRTREEIIAFIERKLITKNFSVLREGYLFEEEELNNRKETRQYYFLLGR